ncbi:MFS transporter [Sulfobacillus sp. hq2]|uniref:MFS transporter n=1 Tax=Sulfobacillus sp. hq2 TaxID=2039167 RepID=UPI000CD0D28D|nr:MFS transporter [Sulfobacillus sp. hq2]POB09829.1 MFS transporter [Sulfobacillus sp. hq2]
MSLSSPKLSRGALWLLITFSGAQTANAVATVFVNLFMLVVAHDLTGLITFNIGYFVALSVVFYAASKVFHGQPPLVPYRWGLFLTMAFYGLLLLLSHHAGHMILTLGIIYGIAQGSYWFGFNLMTFDTIDKDSRMHFFGMSGAINSIAGVAAPLFSGFIISTFSGLGGYLIVFAAALALYAAALIVSSGVPMGPPMHLQPVTDSWRVVAERPDWALIIKTVVIRGTREGITSISGLFLIFFATHNAALVGIYTAATALARMAASLLVTRHVRDSRQMQAMSLGVAGIIGAGLLLLAGSSWPWIFAYGVLFALTLPFYMIPSETIPMGVMDNDPQITQRRVSYTLSREVALNVGRLLTVAILSIGVHWIAAPVMVIILILATSVIQIWNVWAMGRIITPEIG